MEEEAGPSNTAPSRDDEAMPVVDPMLAPLGDAAEEAMRRKLKRRLKDLRRAEKAQKRAKKADKLINDPKSGLVKQKKKKKVKLKEEDAAVDGYRYDRQEANFRGEANVFDRRFFPYREVFHDQDVGRPGPSSRIQPADSPPPPERRRGPSSQVVVVKSGGVEAERWDHSGFEANRRHPPSLPPAVYRGQKPGQRKGLGSYQPRTYEEAFLVGGGPRNMTDARSFRPQERDPYYWADNPRGPASYTDYQYGNGGPPPEQRRPPPRKWEATGSSKPAPPPSATSRMPQHLRWLHERWSMYDNTLCTAKDRAGPVELAELRENSRQTNQLPLASRKQRRQMERNKTEELESRATRNHMPFYVHGEIRFGKMRTFKEFLMGQAEDVENQDRATQLYNQYKLQFRQRAFAEFFQEHSEDEWFLEKYHPVLKVGKETRRQTAVQRRLDVFMQLLVRGWMEVALERNESRKARKLLDAAIVLLEGGDEGDIACLSDLDYVLEEKKEETYTVNAESGVNGPHYSDSSSDEEEDMSGKAPGLQKTEDERASAPNEEELERAQHAKDYSYYIQERMARADDDDVPDMLDNQKLEKRTEYLGSGVFVQQVVDPKKLEEMNLHKTSAIMIRNLPAAVPRAEIEEIVSQTHGGYLRLYLSPPDTANKYLRTAIGSFWYNANIQKIVWKIRGTAIRGVQIVVIEYRDYERKIGYIDGLSGDKSVVLRDIQLCKSLIEHLDKKSRLWGSGEKGEEAPMPSDPAKAAREAMRKGAESAAVNPLLVNLDECLAFHLRELMGAGEEPGKPRKKKKKERDPDAPLVDVDPALTRVLDRLILYLRIVHSVDYYGARYIPDEDDQPRRIGLLTLRGEASRRASPKTLAAYCQHFEGRLAGLLPHEKRLAEEHIELLGKRSVEEEVDRFVDGNIVSVVDGMSRCGLCHKRFTTPDYAKMHLRERHKDKLEEVKWVVVTFNNYLADPTRPSDADFTAAAPPTTNTADTVSTAPKPKTSQKPAFININ